jgi:hypothetical protein
MDSLFQAPLTQTVVKAGLAAGTTSTYSTVGATVYGIKGKAFSKAAVTNGATPATDRNTGVAFAPLAANQGAIVTFAYDAAGNIRCAQGQVQGLDPAGNFIVPPQFPAVADTDCVFGYLVLKAGATLAAPFVFGASNLSAVTGMTYAFQDVFSLPDRPQIS